MERVTIVVGCVVDEDVDRAGLEDATERLLDGADVREVAGDVSRRKPAFAEALFELLRFGFGDVDEEHLRALPGKGLDDRSADARSAARDDDSLVAQAGINGMGPGHTRVGIGEPTSTV